MIGSEKVFVRLGRFNVVVLADGRTERTDAARDHAAARRSQEPRRYIKVTEAEVSTWSSMRRETRFPSSKS
jgi:hypothetical protein